MKENNMKKLKNPKKTMKFWLYKEELMTQKTKSEVYKKPLMTKPEKILDYMKETTTWKLNPTEMT